MLKSKHLKKVKKAANYITDSNENDGVAKAIENISKDDVLEIFLSKGQSLYIKTDSINKNKEFTISFNNISSSKNERVDFNKLSSNINKSTSIMRTRNNSLIKNIQEKYINTKNDTSLLFGGNIVANLDSNISIDIWIDDIYVHLDGPKPESATNRPTTADDILKQFSKTGGTGFKLDESNFNITIDEGLFINIKEINQERIYAAQERGDYIETVETITVADKNASNMVFETVDGSYLRYVTMLNDGELHVFKITGNSLNAVNSPDIQSTIESSNLI